MAMGQLLKTRASIDSHQRRLVSNTKTAIKEAKALCTAAICHLGCRGYVHSCHEGETACTDNAHTLQQSLDESMPDLECKAIEKEGWDHQSFLEACGAALQACPTEVQGYSCTPCSW